MLERSWGPWTAATWQCFEIFRNGRDLKLWQIYQEARNRLYKFIYIYIIQLLWISGFHQISPNETTQNRTWFSHLSWHYLTLFRWAGPAACPLPWWIHLQCCMTPGQVSCTAEVPNLQKSRALKWCDSWWCCRSMMAIDGSDSPRIQSTWYNRASRQTNHEKIPQGPQSMEASLTHFSRCPLVC